MKVAVLAGGQGTRLAEETQVKSKAMVRIGDQPILWHLLKYFEHYGYGQFVIALGYHAESIRDYFRGLGARAEASTEGPCTILRPEAEPGGPSSWSTPGRRPCPADGSSAWHPISTMRRSC